MSVAIVCMVNNTALLLEKMGPLDVNGNESNLTSFNMIQPNVTFIDEEQCPAKADAEKAAVS